MKVRINLRIGPGDSEALRRNIRGVWTGPKEELSRRAFGDSDLADAMVADLAEDYASEGELVDRLLLEKSFEKGPVLLAEGEAEVLLRACSAIRLALREGSLGEVPDEALEAGEADDWLTAPRMREAFACYLFFAGLQEHIIHGLDPAVHEGLNGLDDAGGDSDDGEEPAETE
ncbi:MAG: hypothetical protein JJU00_04330 [Opitutales bacterium]|nr:hypothetical protein [Opitutales bacterium]